MNYLQYSLCNSQTLMCTYQDTFLLAYVSPAKVDLSLAFLKDVGMRHVQASRGLSDRNSDQEPLSY